MSGITLVSRRTIKATPARLFAAWTEPEQLRAWWGPRPVTCAGAEVDLRVGGTYRIVNALPDGGTLVIYGEFRIVEPPRKLVYTWNVSAGESSIVTVRFEPRGVETEVIVVHEDVPSEVVKESHEKGWAGCLEKLARHAEGS